MDCDWIKRILHIVIFVGCAWICLELFLRAIPIAGLILTGLGFVMLRFVGEVEEYSLAVRSDLSKLAMRVQAQEQQLQQQHREL